MEVFRDAMKAALISTRDDGDLNIICNRTLNSEIAGLGLPSRVLELD